MTWSVNRLAARAVALHAPGTPAERLEVLMMLGLVAPDRTIKPDEPQRIELSELNDAGSVDRVKVTVREPNMDRSLVPPGLRDLLPHEKQPKRKTDETDACGTLTGHTRHIRYGEEVCRECKNARNEYAKARRRSRARTANPDGADGSVTPVDRPGKCGTVAGRSVHIRAGERVCRPCADVYNAHQRAKRKSRRAVQEQAQSA